MNGSTVFLWAIKALFSMWIYTHTHLSQLLLISAKTVSQKGVALPSKWFLNGKFLLFVFGSQPNVTAQAGRSHRLSAFAQAPICIRLFGSVCSLWHFLLSHKAAAIILGVKGAPRNAQPAAPWATQSTCVCHRDATPTHTHTHPNLEPDWGNSLKQLLKTSSVIGYFRHVRLWTHISKPSQGSAFFGRRVSAITAVTPLCSCLNWQVSVLSYWAKRLHVSQAESQCCGCAANLHPQVAQRRLSSMN